MVPVDARRGKGLQACWWMRGRHGVDVDAGVDAEGDAGRFRPETVIR